MGSRKDRRAREREFQTKLLTRRLRAGALLHRGFEGKGVCWFLDNNESVAADVVAPLISNNQIEGSGDGLFGCSQTLVWKQD